MSRAFIAFAILGAMARPVHAGDDALAKAVTLYASFDQKVAADKGDQLNLFTRTNDPKLKGAVLFTHGFDAKAFRIASGKGKSGGALEAVDVLPNNGRIYFPARGNIAFKKGGWGGAMSMWIKTDPDKLLKTPFCDPVQITQKGANNGGIWFDFNNAKPRDLRMGVFPAVPDGQKGQGEDDPNAPMVRVSKVGFKETDWHHVVISWSNFDTGKADAIATLYIDGAKKGDVKDRPVAMDWDIDKAGIYIAVNYIGLIDEFAIFNRALTPAEVNLLHKTPGVLKK